MREGARDNMAEAGMSGEFAFIDWLRRRTPAAGRVLLGPGDDTAILVTPATNLREPALAAGHRRFSLVPDRRPPPFTNSMKVELRPQVSGADQRPLEHTHGTVFNVSIWRGRPAVPGITPRSGARP